MFTTRLHVTRFGLITMAVTLWYAASAEAQTTLRWKLKKGEKLTYATEQKTISNGNIMGMEVQTNVSQSTDITWVVNSVDSEGVADITQTIDRIQMKMESPFGAFEYDSKGGKEIEGPFGELLGPVFGAMAGADITVKMDATGEVRDVKLPDKLVESLRSNPILAQFGAMFSEDGIKQMTQGGGGSIGAFPKDSVKKGQSWDKKAELKNPFGTIKIETVSTYAGTESRQQANVDKIELKITQTIEPAPDSMLGIKITSQDGKGAAYFDNKLGRLLEQEFKQKMKMEIDVMGNIIEQDVDTTVTMKLRTGEEKKEN